MAMDQYKVDLCDSICVIIQEKLCRKLGKVYIRVNDSTQGLLTNPDVLQI
jgi:hypothetical protein